MTDNLTERDRLMVATVLRAFVAREIDRRGIAATYQPAAMTISAYDLIEFATEMLGCCDGDNVDLATGVADEIAGVMEWSGLDDGLTQDIAERLEPLPVLDRMDQAHPLDIDAQREAWS